jgi:hypothetical protein
MNDYQKETAFLRQCIRYDDTAEHHQLEERIAALQSDDRCLRRAISLTAVLAALAMAGLCYAAVFLADYPLNGSQFGQKLIIKILCALGVGSSICVVFFLGLGVSKRNKLDQAREECRRLAIKLMEARLGKPGPTPISAPFANREDIANQSHQLFPVAVEMTVNKDK